MPPQAPQYTRSVQEQFPSAGLNVGWPNKFFAFALLVFVAVLLIYFGLSFGYKAFLENSIDNLNDDIDELASRITDEERENLEMLYSQITNMRSLLGDHVASSNVFLLLESITAPNITYTTLGLSTDDEGLVLEGIAGSYADLTVQLALFEQSPYVERYNLQSSEWNSGVIQFEVAFEIDGEVLEPGFEAPFVETNAPEPEELEEVELNEEDLL